MAAAISDRHCGALSVCAVAQHDETLQIFGNIYIKGQRRRVPPHNL